MSCSMLDAILEESVPSQPDADLSLDLAAYDDLPSQNRGASVLASKLFVSVIISLSGESLCLSSRQSNSSSRSISFSGALNQIYPRLESWGHINILWSSPSTSLCMISVAVSPFLLYVKPIMWRVDDFAAFCFPCSLSLNYQKDMFEYVLIAASHFLRWRRISPRRLHNGA